MTPSPLDALVEAIAQRVAEILAPLITNDHAVKPRLLTVRQTAVYIGRTEKSVYMLRANQAFPCVETDSRVMFDVKDLDRWIEVNKKRVGDVSGKRGKA